MSKFFVPGVEGSPEPLEQARYICGIAVAFLFYVAAALVYRWWAKRHAPARGGLGRTLFSLVLLIQGTVGALAVYLWLLNSKGELPYFTKLYLAGAAVTAAFTMAAFLGTAPMQRAASGRTRRLFPRILALGFAAIGLLPAIFTAANVMHANETILYHTSFTLEDFAAVLSGRTPLGDYAPQYQFVLPLLLAPFFRVVGLGFTSFTLAMAALSFAELALAYAILRQLTRADWAALLLFIPFAAIGFHRLPDTPAPNES